MPATLDDLMAELKAIRALLEAKQPTHYVGPPGAGAATPNATAPRTGGRFDDEPVPQPSPAWDLAHAEAHQVHFGKNTGVPLRALKDTSLAFYAKEKEPRLNQYGKPFAKRPADLDLENAARTVWHTRRGTLAGGPRDTPSTPPASTTPAQNDEEDDPF